MRRATLAAIASIVLAVAGLATAASFNVGFAETADLDKPANLDAPRQPAATYRSLDRRDRPYASGLPREGDEKSSDEQCGRQPDGSFRGGSGGSSQALTTPIYQNGRWYYILHWSNCYNSATRFAVRYLNDDPSYGEYRCVSARTDEVIKVYVKTGHDPYIDGTTIERIPTYRC